MKIRNLFELENDMTFQQLNQQVNSFNALKILKLENYEIRHSNILAWLLDPKENHSLHDYFLRKMLEHLILIDENGNKLQYEAVGEILNHSLIESHVYREVKTDNNRFIDLLIVNQQLKSVFLIENKFYSTESKNQLDDYLTFIQNIFEDFSIIPIYLTLDGEEPSNQQYFILTYERIESILHTILMLYREQLSDNVYTFIEEYSQILREKFYPNQEQIMQAIEIYRNHRTTIEVLFEKTSICNKQLQFDSGYQFEFMMKYKNTINYIFNQGKNILSYSFEHFICQQFKEDVLYNAHPTVPNLLPPEWDSIGQFSLREPNYWLGKGIIVWFDRTNDNRLRLTAEIGPMELVGRLSMLEKLEKIGLSIKESSKLEKARYTRFFSQKMDVNKWNDMTELTQVMIDLYNSSEFTLLRKQVAAVLNNESLVKEELAPPVVEKSSLDEKKLQVQNAFKKWMASKNIPENHYRVSSRNLSFKIPLFDVFKEDLGETREIWWWDNGPFLFWMDIHSGSLYFTLEIGPIEADKRVLLMEKIKEKGINFNKKGLKQEAKYTRIHSETISIEELKESEILNALEDLYSNKDLQMILEKLQIVYDEMLNQ
ncbi:PD-(D/E)XK nuclease family protein [Bacillus sp. ISL-4]|uniref:PDDEXK-like family protein n=1 Tax=Bacillus sp. ISL-4 TaxID=2819125 RepID=UPI001BE63B3E|nr:PD-(D/E)XK nuclease family protein [Bacillus sp. ISL-4]MBT2667570.1 PD-(D/E)XK nuclease family protein [Bacillus sp. ISL-4]MBT2673326.1 PD-(D/E)XK nuclease family protein [Streptomyces sp. ISL-14]